MKELFILTWRMSVACGLSFHVIVLSLESSVYLKVETSLDKVNIDIKGHHTSCQHVRLKHHNTRFPYLNLISSLKRTLHCNLPNQYSEFDEYGIMVNVILLTAN